MITEPAGLRDRSARSRVADCLLEIGTEELPAAYLPDLIVQLRDEAEALFQAHHVIPRRVESFGTPRRLVLLVRGLPTVQRRPAEEVRGPSKQASYGSDGTPTKALRGFLRSQGGTRSQLKVVSSAKGEYVYLIKPPQVTLSVNILPGLLGRLIQRLRAPKAMRWDPSGVRFARPIRWLLALAGSTPVPCQVGAVRGGRQTWMGGPLRPRAVRVESIAQYLRALQRAGILLDHRARRARVAQLVDRESRKAGGTVAPEMAAHGLLGEVTFLVEEPVVLSGTFDERYLRLPREVLLASLSKYQRLFAIEARGALLARFVGVLDGTPSQPARVRTVFERILNARLADSLMFWEADHKRLPLEGMARELSGVTFHESLGSMAEKATRLVELSLPLARMWELSGQETRELQAACRLSKADLVSSMVREFPTLQGLMGQYYARDSGQPTAVAEAIGEQYLPAPSSGPAGGRVPKTSLGAALALLDRYDTLAGYFGLGIEPTGDQDPFGLRRAAQGIIEIAWQVGKPLAIDALFEARAAQAPYPAVGRDRVPGIGERLKRYLFERLYTFTWPGGGPSAGTPGADSVDAVLSSRCDNLVDVMVRIRALRQLAGHPSLLKAAKVIERTRNILRDAQPRQPSVNPERLQEGPERRLWELLAQHRERVMKLVNQRSYVDATTVFGEVFYEPVHEFFDQVMVNVPDEPLRQNRLALMQAVHALYTERVADLSKLVVLERGNV